MRHTVRASEAPSKGARVSVWRVLLTGQFVVPGLFTPPLPVLGWRLLLGGVAATLLSAAATPVLPPIGGYVTVCIAAAGVWYSIIGILYLKQHAGRPARGG